MKTASGSFLAKLIASMPLEALRKLNALPERRSAFPSRHNHPGKEETLNRIFMVRYRVQHL